MGESNWPQKIENKKIIVVEGKDDVDFFVTFLDKLGIKDYFVWGLEGKGNFNSSLSDLIKVRVFPDITHLAVIRDKNGDNAFQSITNIFREKMKFSSVPSAPGEFTQTRPRLGVFIMPGNVEGTMLEDLCLKTIEQHPTMRCVDSFISCIKQLGNLPRNLSKAKVQTYLAAQPEIANTIGRGAQKGYWDLDSTCLEELKTFLENLSD